VCYGVVVVGGDVVIVVVAIGKQRALSREVTCNVGSILK